MVIKVLTDNTACGEFGAEWGLSIYVEYNGEAFLLDTGASGLFADNAEKMGVDLSAVKYGILSHGHFDHSDGMIRFFEINHSGIFLVSELCGGDYYSMHEGGPEYIGMRKDILTEYSSRIRTVSGIEEISRGVKLIPHSTSGLDQIALRSGLMLYDETIGEFIPDSFYHEQTLVFETENGLVVCSSCSHAGPKAIIDEVKAVYPDSVIDTYIGGLHLFRLQPAEIRSVVSELKAAGIRKIVTGHCTGEAAFSILAEEFGSRAIQMHSGFEMTV